MGHPSKPDSYKGFRTVFVRGGGFQDIAHQVFSLFCIASAMAVWAVLIYKKNS
jgi:ABC-2 type transport system permease protein